MRIDLALPLCLLTYGFAAPKPGPPAKLVLARLFSAYDHARTYDGTIRTDTVSTGTVGRTVIHVQAVGSGSGALLRSRVEMRSTTGPSTTEMIRVDDGRSIWTYLPRAREYRQEPRRAEKLSNLFRPLIEGVMRSASKLTVRQARFGGHESLVVAGKGKTGGQVALYVDRAAYALLGARAVGASGAWLDLRVSNERWNRPMAGSVFRFSPPTGARRLPAPRPGGVYGRPNR